MNLDELFWVELDNRFVTVTLFFSLNNEKSHIVTLRSGYFKSDNNVTETLYYVIEDFVTDASDTVFIES